MSVNLMLNGVASEGLSGDIVTASQKNMENWTASGEGEVSITYDSSNKSNVVDFSNSGELDGAGLMDLVSTIQGYTFDNNTTNLNNLNSIVNLWKTYGSSLICCVDRTGSAGVGRFVYFAIMRSTDTYQKGTYVGTPGYYITSNQYNSCKLYKYNLANNVWTNENIASGWIFYDTQENSDYVYDDFAEYSVNMSRSYSLTIPTTGKNLITFEAKTPSGFNASADNIQVTYEVEGVATTQTITLDNASSNDYKTYKLITDEVDDEIDLTLDLSTIVSSSAIELDIRNVQCYELG